MARPTAADFTSLASALNTLSADLAANTAALGGSAGSAPATGGAGNSMAKSIGTLTTKFTSLEKSLGKFISTLSETQKQFGVSIDAAANLQVAAFESSVESFGQSLKSLDFTGIGDATKTLLGSVGEGIKTAFTGGAVDSVVKGITDATSGVMKNLSEARPNIAPVTQMTTQKENIAAMKAYQDEFGVLNANAAKSMAQTAKDEGISIQALIQSRRAFATLAMGDLSKVEKLQNNFENIFKQKGLSPRIAMESIAKYSELLARNGTRFADSFARAAADAKKIGIDLNKVSQFGDSIISDFEGFLGKTAELGAMGFNLDGSRLAEISETGSDADLFNELRSQLAATGKDITKLRRSERLALEGMFGMNISEMQKLGGETPEEAADPMDTQRNSLLSSILVAMKLVTPFLMGIVTTLGLIAMAVGAPGFAAGLTIAAAIGLIYTGLKAYTWADELRKEGIIDIQEGRTKEGLQKGAASGALTGTLAGAAAGLTTVGLMSMGTGIGMLPGLGLVAAGAGIGALGGAGLGMSDVYQQGAKNRTAAELEAQRKRDAEQAAANRQMQQFYPRPGTTTPNKIDTTLLGTLSKSSIQRASGGLVTGPGTGKSDSIPARLSNGEFVINADMVKKLGFSFLNKLNSGGKVPALSTGISKAQELKTGGVEGLFSMAQNKFGGMFGGKGGGAMSSISNLFTGGGSTASNLMGMASKIPGLGGLLGKATGLLSGGGGLGGMASGLLGKIGMGGLSSSLLGGLAGGPVSMLGSLAAPLLKKIPFVGGALSSIAGGPGKLLGKLGGSALGKIGGLFGKKKGGMDLSSMLPPNMMETLSGMGPMAEGVNFPAMLAQMLGSRQSSQPAAAAATVDTSGIEQKLDQKLSNFITALSNIQVNMDGTKVGKLLVNVNDVAMTVGVYGAQAR